MEKRFTLFMTLSALILVVHFWLQPPPKPPAKKDKDVAAKKEQANADDKAGEGDAKTAEKPGAEVGPADAKSGNDSKTPPTERPTVRKLTKAPERWATLGSADPAGRHSLLVTFNARGAAIERVEVSSPRYRDLEDDRGYLGHLAPSLSGSGAGVVVNVVGAGTPAALAKIEGAAGDAGLKVGDVILDANGTEIRRVSDFDKSLATTKPGQEFKLKVQRGNETLTLATQLGRRPLEVLRPEPDAPAHDPLSFLLTLDSVGSGKKAATVPVGEAEIDKIASLKNEAWELTQATGELVEFRFVLDDTELQKIGQSGELEIIKRFRLATRPNADKPSSVEDLKSYHVEMEIEIRNNAAEPTQVAYRLDGPNGLPLEGWWYSTKISPYWRGGAGARDVVWRTDGVPHTFLSNSNIHETAKKTPNLPQSPLISEADPLEKRAIKYLALDTQYFVAAVLPEGESAAERAFKKVNALPIGNLAALAKGRERTLNVSFQLHSEPRTVSADKPLQQKLTLYLGPKEKEVLAAYGLERTIELGWWWWVVNPMSWLLHGFYAVVRNYGIAIVMLTIVVRSCMLPISFKMTKNAQKMQALAPEIKKLAEKYKDDLEKRSRAQQELFQKHGVNMYSGCLLVFFQLPVFAGLYRLLAVDINLRQAPLISSWEWCSNLAGPDQFWKWNHIAPGFLSDETGWFGPYLNILPLVTVALFMVNQKLLTPPAADEQQRMQQQIMSFMMIFFAAMFFKVPSGLCIYFIASSLWTLAEHKILKKNQNLAGAAGGGGGGSGDGGNGNAPNTPLMTPSPEARAAEERRQARKKLRR